MDAEEYMSRIMGDKIDLDPEIVNLNLNTIILVLENYPNEGKLLKLRNLLRDNLNSYNEDKEKVDFALSIKVDDKQNTFVLGDIILDMEIYSKILSTFIDNKPILFRYDGGENAEINKTDLINTIRIPMEDNEYGLT